MIAVHISSASFDAIMLHPEWLRDSDVDAAKQVLDAFSPSTGYAIQIREAIVKRKQEGSKMVLLLSLKDDRVQLITLP